MNFDTKTGDLWLADVGQDRIEEVNIIEKGGNYGWRILEGTRCFNPATNCDRTSKKAPVAEYDHAEGQSITGGFVYRGSEMPILQGSYIFGDYVSGTIWSLTREGTAYKRTKVAESGVNISAFGEDNSGELYVLSHQAGEILKLVPQNPGAVSGIEWPALLSETGCFSDVPLRKWATGVLSYNVNSPLWSDNASKERALLIPKDTKIVFDTSGKWKFPNGTVFIKTFLLGNKPIETRFFIQSNNKWNAATYNWNDASSEATLLESGMTKVVNGQNWNIPSRAQCIQCHTPSSGFILGAKTSQLNLTHDMFSNGKPIHQIEALSKLGYFENPLSVPIEQLPKLPDPKLQAASVELRARSYLDSNCSHCHSPGGAASANIDLRFETAFANMNICNKNGSAGDMGINNSKIFSPTMPSLSLLHLRMIASAANEEFRMPSIGTELIDTFGAELVGLWIQSTTKCP
jgi:uncharacterized repeat protein (TIGR03806 family)